MKITSVIVFPSLYSIWLILLLSCSFPKAPLLTNAAPSSSEVNRILKGIQRKKSPLRNTVLLSKAIRSLFSTRDLDLRRLSDCVYYNPTISDSNRCLPFFSSMIFRRVPGFFLGEKKKILDKLNKRILSRGKVFNPKVLKTEFRRVGNERYYVIDYDYVGSYKNSKEIACPTNKIKCKYNIPSQLP